MKIAVLGAGAMGMLIGGFLSRKHDVYLIDVDVNRADYINKNGVTIVENDGSKILVHPKATTNSAEVGEADVVIIFVKALFSKMALESNKSLIGKNTYLLTFQNGATHEDVLCQFAAKERVIIGATNHNASINDDLTVRHGGSGKSYMGLFGGNSEDIAWIADGFTEGGVESEAQDNIRKLIWSKLFVNSSISALTAALQVEMGYMETNANAKVLMQTLVSEAVAVANAEGFGFDEDEIQENVHKVVLGAPHGITSIYADIRDGRKTEVDTISGAVVKAGKDIGVATPSHEFIVNMIHAIEGKK